MLARIAGTDFTSVSLKAEKIAEIDAQFQSQHGDQGSWPDQSSTR